ncbi:hypothetical protein PFISCL1PPCAC_25025, partial [Pristionchus fissidentatus]
GVSTTTVPGGTTTTGKHGVSTTTVPGGTTTTGRPGVSTTTVPGGTTTTGKPGVSTTTVPGGLTTTTPCGLSGCPITTTRPGNNSGCEGGYHYEPGKIVDGNFGKFVGVYTSISACQEACSSSANYGLLPCLGIIYYKNDGLCNVMQYEVPQMSETGGGSNDVVIYTKCGTSPCEGGFT